MKISFPLILASASPRRIRLLQQIGIECTVHPSHINEEPLDGEPPWLLVQRLAFQKAREVAQHHKDSLIIGADTIVVLDGNILGKPQDAKNAITMLESLSGHTHTVYTGFSLLHSSSQKCLCDFETAQVTFRDLETDDIVAYVASGSPMDKAGAYGIQDDFGAVFVRRIVGDYYTVVGLPLSKLYVSLEYFKDA